MHASMQKSKNKERQKDTLRFINRKQFFIKMFCDKSTNILFSHKTLATCKSSYGATLISLGAI